MTRRIFTLFLLLAFALSGCGDGGHGWPPMPPPGEPPVAACGEFPMVGSAHPTEGEAMLTLPEKFAAENARDENEPALLVEVEVASSSLSSESTSQADWEANNGEENVDYDSQPGDVRLASLSSGYSNIPSTHHVSGIMNVRFAQTFKIPAPALILGVRINFFYAYYDAEVTPVHMKLYEEWNWSGGGSGTLLATSEDVYLSDVEEDVWYDFMFSTPVNLEADKEYCFVVELGSAGEFEILMTLPGVYLNGIFRRWGGSSYEPAESSDAAFVLLTPMDGYIVTKNIDLGQTPTSNGEWVFEDIQPADTSITYEAWASDTGEFNGEETSLGAVVDGDPIETLKRYYRVKASFERTEPDAQAPTVQSIKALFGAYDVYANKRDMGFEPSLLSVSSLSTQIDDFEKSSISQVDLSFGLTPSISNWLATKYPRNKVLKVKAGFVAPGWDRGDYIDYFTGAVEDWSINKDTAKISIRDHSKNWKQKVPSKWESSSDDVTWTNEHPIDVMLDILRNHINLRESYLLAGSFDTVKAALSGWKVSRTITDDPEDAEELLQELRLLTGTYFLPQVDGRVKIKRWDPDEAAVDALDDINFFNVQWQANSGKLINQTHIYLGWNGEGTDAADFSDIRVGVDSSSQTNWGEQKVKEIKDKWTLSADAAQIEALEARILARYANPPSVITGDVHRSKIYLEVGDIVTVTTVHAPSSDMQGISAVKFQIVNRNLDHKKDTIRLRLLEV